MADEGTTQEAEPTIPPEPARMQCNICLDDEGEVVQRGCCCRGDAGAAHVACLVEVAVHSRQNTQNAWATCGTCKQMYPSPQIDLRSALSCQSMYIYILRSTY